MNTKTELSQDDIRAIYHQGEDAVVELIMSLITKINALYEKAQRLEDQLTKNSNNSNKPPSSDGLSKPSPKSLRKRHGRKSGGRQGMLGIPSRQQENRIGSRAIQCLNVPAVTTI